MANRLAMADIDSIVTLHTTGHSQRQIAALLQVDRETVDRYVARARAQNRPNAPTGTAPHGEGVVRASGQEPPDALTGTTNRGEELVATPGQNLPNAPTGIAGSVVPASEQDSPNAPACPPALLAAPLAASAGIAAFLGPGWSPRAVTAFLEAVSGREGWPGGTMGMETRGKRRSPRW